MSLSVVEAFVGDGHQLADPVERIGLATAVTEGLVLHASAGLVEHEVGGLHDMKRSRDLVACGSIVSTPPDRPDRSNVAQRIESHHSAGCQRTTCTVPAASRPGTTSNSWPGRRRRPGSTTARRLNGPAGRTAFVEADPGLVAVRSGSSINSRAVMSSTASITVCQSQPRSAAASDTERP